MTKNEAANQARKLSDDFSFNNVGRFLSNEDWLKCWQIEVNAADACGEALQESIQNKEPHYVVKEWQEAIDLHLAFASSARTHIQ